MSILAAFMAGGGDPSTALLLHMDGSDGATDFVDSSMFAHAITRAGDPEIDTAQSVFGGASGLFNNGSIRPAGATIDLSGPFTIDFRIRKAGSDDGECVFDLGSHRMTVFGEFGFFVFEQTNGADVLQGFPVVPSTWSHIAITRDAAAMLRLFLDGELMDDAAGFTADLTAAGFPYIGSRQDGSNDFEGWIDEFRVSTVARWTANFTPPAVPYSV